LSMKRLGKVEHRRNAYSAADEDRQAVRGWKLESISEGADQMHPIAGRESAEPIRSDADDAMDDVQLCAGRTVAPTREGEWTTKECEWRGELVRREIRSAARLPIDLTIRCMSRFVIPIAV